MELNIVSVLWYVLLLDAVGANILAWSGGQYWWQQNLTVIARHFPLSRGWTSYYLLLVIFMGIIFYRFGALVVPW